ncbi:hypothetical protein P154DRAFT_616649 [Amniculicola lignicola CBS 123094]|uniref:Uncharacterized protein n=1 Tax=Amniculicola lignicola CBS 123094 TaxID=1392246 RepID=A0A6A5WSU0_9PLEO|nr:hypothetical protein P154DRAFT_616649 [Amniculicola lignicola CBS 123094]
MAPSQYIDLTQDDAFSTNGRAARHSRHTTSSIKLPRLMHSDCSNHSADEEESFSSQEDVTLSDVLMPDEEEHSVDDVLEDEGPSRIEDTVITEEGSDSNTITPVDEAGASDIDTEDPEEPEGSRDPEPLVLAVDGDIDLVVGNDLVGYTRFLVDSAKLKLIPKWNELVSSPQQVLAGGSAEPDDTNDVRQDRETCNEITKASENVLVLDMQLSPTSPPQENVPGVAGSQCSAHRSASPAAQISPFLQQPKPWISKVWGAPQTKDGVLKFRSVDAIHNPSQPRSTSEQYPTQSLLGSSLPKSQDLHSHDKNKRISFPGWCKEELLKLDGQNSDLTVGTALPEPAPEVISSHTPLKSTASDVNTNRDSMTLVDQPGDLDVEANRQLDHEGSLQSISNNVEKALPDTSNGMVEDVLHPTSPHSSSEILKRICLPAEDSEAVGIALVILHSRFDMLPSAATFDTLYQLALHCETFGTEDILLPFVRPWMQRHLPRALEVGSIKWLYIAWIFKLPALFKSHLHYFVCTSEKNDERLSSCNLPGHGCGNVLSGIVKALRMEMLETLLAILHQYLDEDYWRQHYACHLDDDDCAEHAYVAFAVKLRALGLWPSTPSATALRHSPSALREKFYAISINPYSDKHVDCATLLLDFQRDVLVLAYQLSDSYLAHFTDSDSMGKASHLSQIGTYFYDYGWAPEDWGYTSLVKSKKRRAGGVDLTHWTSQNRFAMADALSDDEDSDFEADELEADELEYIYERLDDEEIEIEGQPPRKKARRNPPLTSMKEVQESEHDCW